MMIIIYFVFLQFNSVHIRLTSSLSVSHQHVLSRRAKSSLSAGFSALCSRANIGRDSIINI